jgi:hypothetical protein
MDIFSRIIDDIYGDQFRSVSVTSCSDPDLKFPAWINTGWCYYWALLAKLTFPEAELWSSVGHAFIKLNGRFYDSESPNGTDRATRLKTYQNNKRLSRIFEKDQPIEKFGDQWDIQYITRKLI